MINSGMIDELMKKYNLYGPIIEHAPYYYERIRNMLSEVLSPSQEPKGVWTDSLIKKLVGNYMAEILTTDLKDNLKGKINITELSEKFHAYLTKFKEQKGIK